MKKIKVGVVVPVRNVLRMTQEAIETFKSKHKLEIIVVDDWSRQEMKDWLKSRSDIHSIIDPANSTGLAFNWNTGVRKAFELNCKYVLIANNDVICNSEMIDRLVTRMESADAVMVTASNMAGHYPSPQELQNKVIDYDPTEDEHPDFSMFMISQQTIDKIGWFDENYHRGYFEDNDYHARIALANEKALKIGTAIYWHFASQTSAQNPDMVGQISQSHNENRYHFSQKWGTTPVGDTPQMRQVYFKTPFNDPNKTIKDW